MSGGEALFTKSLGSKANHKQRCSLLPEARYSGWAHMTRCCGRTGPLQASVVAPTSKAHEVHPGQFGSYATRVMGHGMTQPGRFWHSAKWTGTMTHSTTPCQ